jgi:hypothetical protein
MVGIAAEADPFLGRNAAEKVDMSGQVTGRVEDKDRSVGEEINSIKGTKDFPSVLSNCFSGFWELYSASEWEKIFGKVLMAGTRAPKTMFQELRRSGADDELRVGEMSRIAVVVVVDVAQDHGVNVEGIVAA